MIFTSKNESGIPKWEWILSLPPGSTFVTRRILHGNTYKVCQDYAVCPGRGKKAVCRARVISIMMHDDWCKNRTLVYPKWSWWLEEAQKEGFKSWDGWLEWYPNHKIDINNTKRIEMVKL